MKERIEVMFTAEEITKRLEEIAQEVYEEFGDEQVEMVCVLKGGVVTLVELAKKMKIECHANSDSCIYTVGRLEQIRPFRDRFVGKLPIVDHALTEQITNDIIYKIVCIDNSLEKMNEFAKQVNLHCSGASCVRSEGNFRNADRRNPRRIAPTGVRLNV